MFALVLVTLLVALAAPSAFAAWRMQKLGARLDSLLDHVASLGIARALAMGFLALVHLPGVRALARASSVMEPAAPGHQYGPRFEVARADLVGVCRLGALASILAVLFLFVLLIFEVVAVARLLAARKRLAKAEAAVSIPPPDTPLELDLGVGEDYWVLSRESGAGYREPPSPVRFARGSAEGWSAPSILLSGPAVTVFAFAATFVLFGADVLFSAGD
jgi:hypothetical protein